MEEIRLRNHSFESEININFLLYFPKDYNLNPELSLLSNLTENDYKKRYKKSTVLRTGWKNFIRNVKYVLKNIN